MTGFFDIPKTANTRGQTCVSCGLYAKVRSPRIEPYGKFQKRILCIGEAAGEREDLLGKPWQGKVGQMLQSRFSQLGCNLFEDCVCINALGCRPTDEKGNNRPPTSHEIACCRSRVLATIKQYKPHVIILFGGAAVESVIGHRWQGDLGAISKWTGWHIPDRDLSAWVCPVFHPSYVERGEKEIETIWIQDLSSALSMSEVSFPKYKDEARQVQIITDPSVLKQIESPFAFDYETTGLKSHSPGHKIICTAVSDRSDRSFAFMMTDEMTRAFKKLLIDGSKQKIAQNMRFEYQWSHKILGCEVKNWLWDPMLASHILDNRPDITGLKFQVYIQFGRIDYSSEVAEYLKAKDSKNGNAKNRIEELIKTESGKRKLLTYCGLDALYERRLAMKQMRELNAI